MTKPKKEQANTDSKKSGFFKTILWPFPQSGLGREVEAQKRILTDVRLIRKQSLKAIFQKKEQLNSDSDLWEQNGIETEKQLAEALLKLYKLKNMGVIVTSLCAFLFILSTIFGVTVLALIFFFVFALEGLAEITKASWRIHCLKNNEFMTLSTYVKERLFK